MGTNAAAAATTDSNAGSNTDLDRELAARYGAYASFPTAADPVATETHGDAPDEEVDRLLDIFSTLGAHVLDLGCGAGQTLCRLAPRVAQIWGVDLEEPLLNGARDRAARLGLTNVTLILGDTTAPDTANRLPEAHFDLVFSRRGPFLTSTLMAKLRPDAHFVVELYQDVLGLKEIFGRRAFLPGGEASAGADACVRHHMDLGMLPVSIKLYYFAQYFRDGAHLASFLSTGAALSNWWMPPRPYDPSRDSTALDLYARYNTTARGVRLIQQRKVYLFRRAVTTYYPVDAPDRALD